MHRKRQIKTRYLQSERKRMITKNGQWQGGERARGQGDERRGGAGRLQHFAQLFELLVRRGVTVDGALDGLARHGRLGELADVD